jgi:predicted lipid-binding transport protein (Tim44 family)
MLLDIIIFAVIALFIVNRYWQVLGTPPDRERVEKPRYSETPQQQGGKVVTLPVRRVPAEDSATTGTAAPVTQAFDDDTPPSLATMIQRVQAHDPHFNEKSFLAGARAAFTMIVSAFAAGDKDALRPLLAGDVERNFLAAIDRRQAADHRVEFELERIRDADIAKIRLDGAVADVTVEILSEQVNVVRDATGSVIEGHADRIEDVRDIWTFRRNLQSPDPNWELVATHSATP